MAAQYAIHARWSDAAEAVADAETWASDADPAVHERIDARNRTWSRALQDRLPGLVAVAADFEELQELIDPGVATETALRRARRYTVLRGPWSRGELTIRISDTAVDAEIVVAEPGLDAAALQVLEADLAVLLGQVASATGLAIWDPSSRQRLEPTAAATLLLARHANGLRQCARQVRRARRMQRWGLPSAVLLTMLALGAAAFLVREAVSDGTLAARTDPTRTATFVTERLEAPARDFPAATRYALSGRIDETRQMVRLEVSRDQFVRAAPGARYTVLSTSDATTPFLLRPAFEERRPFVRVGEAGISWLALLALAPIGLWLGFVWRPWWRHAASDRPRVLAQMTATLSGLLKALAVVAVVVLVRQWR
jgi:hypothetical protein